MFKSLRAWFSRQPRRHTVRIDVTHEDIIYGMPCASATCPIALAAHRTIACEDLQVCNDCLIIIKNGYVINSDLPNTARAFIKRYDRGLPVEPFQFEISFLDRRS